VSPSQRRAAVAFLVRKHRISERRACKVVGVHRSTNRYAAVPTDFEARLVAAMKELADRFPRYGYRRVHALLVAEGWNVNVKRIERLWVLEGLQVPPRRLNRGQKALGTSEFSAWALPALRPTHIWSYDFVSVRLVMAPSSGCSTSWTSSPVKRSAPGLRRRSEQGMSRNTSRTCLRFMAVRR